MLPPHTKFFLICTLIGILFFPDMAKSYPQFIGYKYSSCITCHYNGHGNGPLSDYGRALWAAEIGGRLFAGERSDEKLAEESGFLGSKPLPWWIRPGFKARQLIYQTNPPKGDTRSITMQAEANLALFLDQDQKYIFVGSFGYVPVPNRYENQNIEKPDEWTSREHYVRVQATQDLWLYAGMTDKVYGIRIVNHTAYSRARTGLGQNDQSHGIIAHYIRPNWEISLNAFVGNLFQDEDLRQIGASTLMEYEIKEAWRLGITGLSSANKYLTNQRFGLLSRYGMGDGSAVLAELGLITDTVKGGDSDTGYYLYSEAIQKVVRGYHAFVGAQLFKDSLQGQRAENLKTTLGLLAFPLSRVEYRIELENVRQLNNSSQVQRDVWYLLGQLHLSF